MARPPHDRVYLPVTVRTRLPKPSGSLLDRPVPPLDRLLARPPRERSFAETRARSAYPLFDLRCLLRDFGPLGTPERADAYRRHLDIYEDQLKKEGFSARTRFHTRLRRHLRTHEAFVRSKGYVRWLKGGDPRPPSTSIQKRKDRPS